MHFPPCLRADPRADPRTLSDQKENNIEYWRFLKEWPKAMTRRDETEGRVVIEHDGTIATVTLDNPGKRNALNAAMWRSLAGTMRMIGADPAVRCVVIRGAGEEAFAAGGDIEEFLTLRASREQALQYHGETVAPALAAVADCLHPTLALIQGACIGGGLEIAAQCDLRIAGEGARFGVPINRLGFTMYHEELRGLLALAGPATTLELLLEGRLLPAPEAGMKGLVTRVVPDARVADEAYVTARRIAAGAPLPARAHKRLVRRLMRDASPLSAAELDENLAYLDSDDYRAGMQAFLDKSAPDFRGR
jgi:enoyl-CoA hydratase/carnithine racemase